MEWLHVWVVRGSQKALAKKNHIIIIITIITMMMAVVSVPV